ncbi:uncharacterized protein LOC132827782 [Hemiscyllium ocellatum]|uniref:uncharacterized protein LOC132827782 n=1 Tax=Hemiscyllium ocellatum TaxID=170820 RepID=UPI0029670344|nr:uncharacterized protein LOC132827782 [Hemiscyllium ocellatum]XP_060700472.1 uncharacterized protein LOC132827782 [Hemiscyllium ocellatum]XP_060700473.1 uncharacterized protein LOC132827782 [Hemiscyllium ocellatum]XP_060700474.1 uncharacterized protein LOC132827782 [Hemiscyllium ocellatum]XP_060700475.1 uncharacterized protein LOC132827782 [Hemiscyllium ocellatum]
MSAAAVVRPLDVNLCETTKWVDDIESDIELVVDNECCNDFCKLKPGGNYLSLVTEKVQLHSGKTVELQKNVLMTIGGLDYTIYWGRHDLLKGWQEFYLPQRMDMVVLGVIESYPCLAPGLQLVILAGNDGSVFAYEEEMLHKIATNLKMLFNEGPVFPGTEKYEYGKDFLPKSNEKYMEALKKAKLEKVSQGTKDFISKNAAEMKKLIDGLDFKKDDFPTTLK